MSLQLSCIALVLLAGDPGAKKTNAYPRADLLVEAADLAKLTGERKPTRGGGQVRILDARAREEYLAGHIPGAVWVDHDQWSRAFARGQDSEGWGKRIGGLGIRPDTRVVGY